MKVTVFLLSILLLVSCSPENLWQKVGLASPEPIEITSKTGSPKGNEEDEVDVMKCFVGDRKSVVSFSIRKPESLRGDILYPQDKKEAEKMAEMLNAKCFSQHQIKAFLSSEIEDKDLVFAMQNTVFLLNSCRTTLIDSIEGFLPEFPPATEESPKEYKEILEYYNSFKGDVSKVISGLFVPLLNLFSSSETPTWGEYIKCQLMINLLSGVLEGMERTVEEVFEVLSSEEMMDVVFNLGNEEEIEELQNKLMEVEIHSLLDAVNSLVSSVLPPLAVYNSISYKYGNDINLMSLSQLLEKLEGV